MCSSVSKLRQKDVTAVAVDHVTMLAGSTHGPSKKGVKSLLKDKLALNVEERLSENRKIQRAVKRAKEDTVENFNDGFAFLQSYVEEIKAQNPDCICVLENTMDGKFYR